MENCSRKFSAIGQLFPECTSDAKSRYMHSSNQSNPKNEVICPEPRRATRSPHVMDNLNRFNSKPLSIFPVRKGNHGLSFLDAFLSEDDIEGCDGDSSNQMGFFCGSPPVRTDNPIVHDAQFTKQTQSLASSFGSCHGMKPPTRVERGSPTCGSSFGASPKVRVEGFACGNPESPRRIVPALA